MGLSTSGLYRRSLGDDGEADGWSQCLPSPSVAFGTSLHVD